MLSFMLLISFVEEEENVCVMECKKERERERKGEVEKVDRKKKEKRNQ